VCCDCLFDGSCQDIRQYACACHVPGVCLLCRHSDGADIIVPELGDGITLQDLWEAPASVRDHRKVPR